MKVFKYRKSLQDLETEIYDAIHDEGSRILAELELDEVKYDTCGYTITISQNCGITILRYVDHNGRMAWLDQIPTRVQLDILTALESTSVITLD